VLGLFPDWFAEPASDWPANTRLTGFIKPNTGTELPEDLKKFLSEGEPPLIFTAGSSMQNAVSFFRTACRTATILKRRAVLISAFPQQLPTLPGEGIFHCRFAPFDRLFLQAAVIVHHGGIGTVAAAIAAGKPQLIVPFAHDQPDNARRIGNLGLGSSLGPGRFTAKAASRKIEFLLDSESIQLNCRNYSRMINFDESMSKLLNTILDQSE
jgi:rhamnosyltransferase subunit B